MKKVSLFIPCSVNHVLPETGEATYHLLKKTGVDIGYHEAQTCCGQILYNKGFKDEARDFAKHFIEVFEKDDYIVSPSGSCTCMVKHNYPELLSDDPEWMRRAVDVSKKIYELSEFIVDILGVKDTDASFNGKVAYHESCHVNRGLGVSAQPKALIEASKGTELVHMEYSDQCCGFGGEFASEYSDISGAIVDAKVTNFINSNADLLVLCEPGCLLNINGYLSRNHPDKKAVHIADFLVNGGGIL